MFCLAMRLAARSQSASDAEFAGKLSRLYAAAGQGDHGRQGGFQEGNMTTPQQPGDDLKVEPEVIEDLDLTGDDADAIAGGGDRPTVTGCLRP
jgi:hypothetical protein